MISNRLDGCFCGICKRVCLVTNLVIESDDVLTVFMNCGHVRKYVMVFTCSKDCKNIR